MRTVIRSPSLLFHWYLSTKWFHTAEAFARLPSFGFGSPATRWATLNNVEGTAPLLIPSRVPPEGVEILSKDPLVYLVPNLLTKKECHEFMDRAQELQDSRPMKQSNPPEISLDFKKLWPLPFLSLGAGIPPVLRCFVDGNDGGSSFPSMDQVAAAFFPPVMIAFSTSLLLAFGVVLPLVRKLSDSKSRTSVAMALNLNEDVPYVTTLVDKVSLITQHPWHAWEAPVMTRYSPGAIFARHSDASPTRGSEWKEDGGQRVVTCICYLNTVEKSGATSFDKLGFAVSPVQGSALIFFPTVPGDSLEADARLTHESLLAEEEKCIIQMFGRVGPRVPLPLGLPDSYGGL
jgi:hypothetical protein